MAEPIPLTRSGPGDADNFEFHWSGNGLEIHLLSDVGRKRTHNEDSCVLCVPDDRNLLLERGTLVVVADGMGGVSGGRFASKLAVQTLVETYYIEREPGVPVRLRQGVLQANRSIYEEAESRPEYHGMGTTVSAVVVIGDRAYIAHVGDSRVYLYRNGAAIMQITEDHSLVAEQVREGVLTEEQARSHSLRNLITRAVGTKESVKVDLFSVRVREGDRLMICSDGLTGPVDPEGIAECMQGPKLQGVARSLVGRALEGGGPDNITVALVGITEPPVKTEPDAGAVEVNVDKPGIISRLRGMFS